MSFTVYVHISPSNKRYVGITSTSVEHRWGRMGKNYSQQPLFWRAIQKYGWDNLEHVIVAEGLSKDEACDMERQLIEQYHSNDRRYGYNLSEGGESTFCGVKHTKEWNAKISKALMGNRSRRGQRLSERERSLLSTRMRGNNYGAHRNITDDYRKRAVESQPNRAVIEQYTLDGELVATYRSVNEAHRVTGIWNIAEASRDGGGSRTSGGYIWKRRKGN